MESFNSPLYDNPKKRILKILLNRESPLYEELHQNINNFYDEINDKNIDFDFDTSYDINNKAKAQLYGYDEKLLIEMDFEDPRKMFQNIFKFINKLNIYKVEKDIEKRKIIDNNRRILNEIIDKRKK
jgi:hypothetical protein